MRRSAQHTRDVLLWESFLRGDKQSFSQIYQNYYFVLREYGVRLQRNEALVKDGIQDLFLKLWTNRRNLQPVESVKAYLCMALRRTILNNMDRTQRMEVRGRLAVEVNGFDLHYSTIEQTLIAYDEQIEIKQQISAALNTLTSRQKESIFLRFYLKLDYGDIASVMNISVKATYKVVGRAIAVMREHLGAVPI